MNCVDFPKAIATVLADPEPHLSRIIDLTGPKSQDMHAIAREYSAALNREISYADISPQDWKRTLKPPLSPTTSRNISSPWPNSTAQTATTAWPMAWSN